LDGNDALDSFLQQIAANTDDLKQLQAAVTTEAKVNA
jgi:hypothetical protein